MITASEPPTAPQLRRLAVRPDVQLWGYLVFVTLAELVTAAFDAQLGQLMHVLLLAGLALHAALAPDLTMRRFLLALMLAPLIRVLSLSLPLTRFPQLAWYPMVAVPLFLSAWVIIRQLRLSRHELGLRLGNLPLQLGIGGLGVVLGVCEYYILAPRPQFENPSLSLMAFSALNLLIATGFSEELIFRGILQAEGRRTLGKWALLYVSLLFGVLHIGYLSLLDVIFVSVVGLLFAYLVLWTGSILGVTLAHGITNSMLFLVMPALTQDPALLQETPWAPWAFAATTLITLSALTYVVGVQLRRRRAAERADLTGTQVWLLRNGASMSLEELSARSGLSTRALAELEAGFYQPLPDERQRLATALDVAPAMLLASPGELALYQAPADPAPIADSPTRPNLVLPPPVEPALPDATLAPAAVVADKEA